MKELLNLSDRYQGVFTNIHTGRKAKLIDIEYNPAAEGGYIAILEGNDRWSGALFAEHWDGDFSDDGG